MIRSKIESLSPPKSSLKGKLDLYDTFGIVHLSSGKNIGPQIKKLTTVEFADEDGEHVSPRAFLAAFDYTVELLVFADKGTVESANTRIENFNNFLIPNREDRPMIKFYNEFKKCVIVGYPYPVSEASSFYRSKDGYEHDVVKTELKIRVSDPTLCDWDTTTS